MLAREALNVQVEQIAYGIDQVLMGRPLPSKIVVSGSGEVVVRETLGRHTKLAEIPVVSMAERFGYELAQAACAYAVAVLATEQVP
jgi:uncharacterized hydantoinase/oxoprolinase family protein